MHTHKHKPKIHPQEGGKARPFQRSKSCQATKDMCNSMRVANGQTKLSGSVQQKIQGPAFLPVVNALASQEGSLVAAILIWKPCYDDFDSSKRVPFLDQLDHIPKEADQQGTRVGLEKSAAS